MSDEKKNLTIRQCSMAEIEGASNIKELLEEYGSESGIDGLPPPVAKMEIYKLLEKSNSIFIWGAFLDTELIGFIAFVAPVLGHYSVRVSVSESFFVTKKHRKTGAGIRLLREAERAAEGLKSPGLLISAPIGSNLAEILPRLGYRETTRAFFRKLGNA